MDHKATETDHKTNDSLNRVFGYHPKMPRDAQPRTYACAFGKENVTCHQLKYAFMASTRQFASNEQIYKINSAIPECFDRTLLSGRIWWNSRLTMTYDD